MRDYWELVTSSVFRHLLGEPFGRSDTISRGDMELAKGRVVGESEHQLCGMFQLERGGGLADTRLPQENW